MRLVIITIPLKERAAVLDILENMDDLTSLCVVKGENSYKIETYVATGAINFVLKELDKIGCGTDFGCISTIACESMKPRIASKPQEGHDGLHHHTETNRLAIEEIYSRIEESSSFDFDYITGVVVAGSIAAVGLASNNAVMIVASMLVSPLMGPILAFTFGFCVKDKALVIKGLKTESLGVLITFVLGFLFGLCFTPFAVSHLGWPTDEMLGRGQEDSLLIGLAFAIPSGVGVAQAVSSGGVNSLVGVAIAAALLPPIVNSGMCLAYGALGPSMVSDDINTHTFLKASAISFGLFLLNVVVIFVVGVTFFKFKAVAPLPAASAYWMDLPKVAKLGKKPWNKVRNKSILVGPGRKAVHHVVRVLGNTRSKKTRPVFGPNQVVPVVGGDLELTTRSERAGQ